MAFSVCLCVDSDTGSLGIDEPGERPVVADHWPRRTGGLVTDEPVEFEK